MILTLSLKLHNPSKAKMQFFDDAIAKYASGLNLLLSKADFDMPKSKKEQWDSIYTYLKANFKHCPKPFRDALQKDFTAIVMKNFAKGQKNAPIKCKYVFFCRYSGTRDYALFFDTNTNRYYVKMQLLSTEQQALSPHANKNTLQMVGGDFVLDNKHPRYILAPLSFGKRQQEILELAKQGKVKLKTARLIKKGKDYFFNIAVDLKEEPLVACTTYLSITRTLKHYFHYTLTSLKGDVIKKGFVDKVSENREENLHIIANTFVDMAVLHKSNFVLERLAMRNDSVSLNNITPALSIKEYLRFGEILKYKAKLKGLAPPIMLTPTRLFITCPKCAKATRNNRMTDDIFLCTGCGYAVKTEEIGSINLINKLIKYSKDGICVEKRKVHNGYVYVNRVYKIAWICKNDQDFYNRLEGLKQAKEYDKVHAPLRKKLEGIENMGEIELNTFQFS